MVESDLTLLELLAHVQGRDLEYEYHRVVMRSRDNQKVKHCRHPVLTGILTNLNARDLPFKANRSSF